MSTTQDMDSGSGFGALVPTGLGLLGLVLGAAGLYFGLGAKSQLKEAVAEQAALRELINKNDSKFSEVANEIQGLKANGPEALRAELNGKIETLVSAVNENRIQLNETRKDLATVASKTGSARPSSGSAVVATSNNGGPAVPVSGGSAEPSSSAAGTHTIAKGEYFATVAKKYGVPVATLEKLNPGVDSRRLKIGQSIKIPTK